MNMYTLLISLLLIDNEVFEIKSLHLPNSIYPSYDDNQTLQENFNGIMGALCPHSIYCAGVEGIRDDSYVYSSETIRTAREGLKEFRSVIKGCCRSCSCSADCHVTDNCCIDARPSDTLSAAESSQRCLQADIDQYRPPFLYQKDTQFYYMATKCPNMTVDRNENITQACESPDTAFITNIIPVQSAKTKLIYRNKYCAICNGEETYDEWETTAFVSPRVMEHGREALDSRDELYSAAMSVRHKIIQIVFLPPKGGFAIAHQRRCFLDLQDSSSDCEKANDTDSSVISNFIKNACYYRKFLFSVQYRTMNNMFCAFCDGNNRLTLSDGDGLCGSYINKNPGSMIGLLVRGSDFYEEKDRNSKMLIPRTKHTNCTCREWHDEITNTCRHVYCAMGEEYISCKCMPYLKKISGLPMSAFLRLHSVDSQTSWAPEETDATQAVIKAVQKRIVATIKTDLVLKTYTMFRHIYYTEPVYDLAVKITLGNGKDTRDATKFLFNKFLKGVLIRVNGVTFEIKMGLVELMSVYEKIPFYKKPVIFDPQLFERYGNNTTLYYANPEFSLITKLPSLVFGKHIFCQRVIINEQELDFLNNRNVNVTYVGVDDISLSLSHENDSTFMCLDDYRRVFGPDVSAASNRWNISRMHILSTCNMLFLIFIVRLSNV